MRTYLFFGVAGIFALLVVLGILSISPVLDNPVIDNGITRQITSLFTKKSPQINALPIPTPVAAPTATLSTTTKVLGIQTTTSAVSKDVLYGLINGFRRDKKQDILVVDRALEQAAGELHAINRDSPSTNDANPEAILNNYGYEIRSFTILTNDQASSNWQVLLSWQNNPRDAMLLQSPSFNQMGLSVLCKEQMNGTCSTLVLLATKR